MMGSPFPATSTSHHFLLTQNQTAIGRGGDRLDATPVRRKLSRRRKLLFFTCAFTGFMVLALVLAEIGLRAYHGVPLSLRPFRMQRVLKEGAPAIYDARLGWTSRPGTLEWSEGFESTVDEDGMRSNGAAAAAAAGPPILAVGDSYTFGNEVADAETWPAQLEAALGRRVINAGVSGYGVDQAVLYAEALVDRYRPEAVVLAIIPDDILRCELSMFFAPKPYFDVVDGELHLLNQPVPRSDGMTLWTFLSRSLLARKIIHAIDPDLWMAQTREHDRGTEVASRLVTRLADRVRSRGSKLILIAMPSRMGTSPALMQVAAHAREAGVPVLDLATQLNGKFHEPHGDRPTWFLPMGHLCPDGNGVVAEAIAEFVRKNS